MSTLDRRTFLSMGSILTTGLLLGACGHRGKPTIFVPRAGEPSSGSEQPMLGWLYIGTDELIKVAIPNSEMGQGVYTNLALLVAEELDVPLEQVEPVAAPIHEQFNNPKMRGQLTGGSTSTMSFWKPMREAGAAARLMLLEAAAQQWGTPVESLRTESGTVVHGDGSRLSYGALATAASTLPLPSGAALKPPGEYRLIGKPHKRWDTPAKTKGEPVFGMDVTRPDMLYAAVQQTRTLHGTLLGVDGEAAVREMDGVVDVLLFERWVAVVAKGWWQASQGMRALTLLEDNEGVPTPSSTDHRTALLEALDDHGKSDWTEDSRVLDVQYEVPLLEHATMSPLNCTAHVQGGACDVWAPTQAQSGSHKVAMEITGLAPDQVRIHTTLLGGGFGRRAETDFVHQAVTLSKKLDKPVKVIWSREETTRHGFYRPAAISRFQIALNEKNEPHRWANQAAMPNMLMQKVPGVPEFVWKMTGDVIGLEGVRKPPYAAGEKDVTSLHVDLHTPLGFWRAVGHSHNGFFVESVVDELAHLAEEDPAAYRRRFYQEHPRHLAVIDALTDMSQWNGDRKEGHHLGIAVHESFGSVVGEVVELSVSDKETTLHKVWCVIHCGQAVNPDSVKAQMEGGIIFGLSAATRGKITLKEGAVEQSNFHDYPMMKMSETPSIEVKIIESTDDPTGVGETAVPPIAPAVANAIFAATGERLRRLPFSDDGYRVWRSSQG
jgi:isoquinoline 1-oxidoreductase subunit beta